MVSRSGGLTVYRCVNTACPCSSIQSKIHAARSLSEIAIDLTETGTLKTSKLANMGSKGKIISGSSGSLLSSGQCAFAASEENNHVGEIPRQRFVFVLASVDDEESCWQPERQKQLWLERDQRFCVECSQTCTVLTPHPVSFSMYRTPLPCHTDSSSRGPRLL